MKRLSLMLLTIGLVVAQENNCMLRSTAMRLRPGITRSLANSARSNLVTKPAVNNYKKSVVLPVLIGTGITTAGLVHAEAENNVDYNPWKLKEAYLWLFSEEQERLNFELEAVLIKHHPNDRSLGGNHWDFANEIIKFIKEGADINCINSDGRSLLSRTVARERGEDAVKILIDIAKIKYANNPEAFNNFINSQDKYNRSVFWHAVESGNVANIKTLLNAATTIYSNDFEALNNFINSRDLNGSNPLSVSVWTRNIEVFQVLINLASEVYKNNPEVFNAFINAKDYKGCNALDHAVDLMRKYRKDSWGLVGENIANELIQHGVKCNISANNDWLEEQKAIRKSWYGKYNDNGTITLPAAELLYERLCRDNIDGYFLHKSGLVDKLAEKTINLDDVVEVIRESLAFVHGDTQAELVKIRVSLPSKMTSWKESVIIKAILEDFPEEIKKLENSGVLKNKS